MKNTLDRVSIRPGVSLLTVLPHLNYKPWYALAEFVDNAIQSYVSNKPALRRLEGKRFVLAIDIDIDAERGTIVVRDNAAGIGLEAYPRAFRPAEMPADASGLSEFGMGMKSAAAWLAPRWTVRTSALGEVVERAVSFDIASIVADTVEELEVTTRKADRDAHFTEIVLSSIRKAPKNRTLAKIREHLASLYRRFITKGEVMISLNGEQLSYEQPEVLIAPYWRDAEGELQRWRVPIEIKLEDGRRVEGWAALRARGSTTQAGFALLRRDRVIEGGAEDTFRPRELFGSSNSFVYQRLFGELNMIGFAVSHTKDGIRWDEAEDELTFKLRDALSRNSMPLLDQALNWRASGVASQAPLPLLENRQSAARRAPRSGIRITTLESSDRSLRIARTTSIKLAGEQWEVELSLDGEHPCDDWLQVHSLEPAAQGKRLLRATISKGHPFTATLLSPTGEFDEGVARLVTGLVIAEAIAQDDGVRSSGRIRSSLNELLLLGLSTG